MQPSLHDEAADRAAEERSEDDGMAEHRAKARAPAERGPGRTGVFGVAMVSCVALAALAFARGAVRRLGAGARAAASPGRHAR